VASRKFPGDGDAADPGKYLFGNPAALLMLLRKRLVRLALCSPMLSSVHIRNNPAAGEAGDPKVGPEQSGGVCAGKTLGRKKLGSLRMLLTCFFIQHGLGLGR
jgi:hypothetical protein